jgi:hypothetical protein
MLEFILGMNSALCFVAALFFVSFWAGSKERLLLLFGIAFAILGADWLVLAILPSLSSHANEHNTVVYSVRLLSFLIMLGAIVDKNWRASERMPAEEPPIKQR